AVFAKTKEIEVRAHLASAGSCVVVLAMARMVAAKPRRYEHLDAPADQLLAAIAEKLFDARTIPSPSVMTIASGENSNSRSIVFWAKPSCMRSSAAVCCPGESEEPI